MAIPSAIQVKQWLQPPRFIVASVVASFGGFLFGLDTGTIGPITAMPQFEDTFGAVSSTIHGLIVSSILIPAALASFMAGHLADKVGRPRGMMVGGIIFGTGAALESGSVHLAMLFIGRIITGVGEGLFLSTVIVYICEVAPPKNRGIIGSVPQLLTSMAIFVGYFICYGTVTVTGSLSWRLPFAFQSLCAYLYALSALFFLPESPRWLKVQGRLDDAKMAWEKLETSNSEEEDEITSPDPAHSLEPISVHRTITQQSVKENVHLLLKVFAKDVRGRTLLGVFIMGMQQLSGIDGVLYYAPLLFKQAGLVSSQSSFLASGLTGTVIFIATIPGTFLADRWSRRASIIYGGLALAATMLTMGSLYASNSVHNDHGAGRWVVVACIYCFAFVFSVSWAISMKIFTSEVQPLKTRAAASSLAQSSNWVVNWIVAFTTPIFLAHSTFGAYFLFGGSCLVTAIVCAIYMPETRGLSLEQIDGQIEKINDKGGERQKWRVQVKEILNV